MRTLTDNAIAHLVFDLSWHSDGVQLVARQHGEKASLWRDIFPDGLERRLPGAEQGQIISASFAPGTLLPAASARDMVTIAARDWDCDLVPGLRIEPAPGRYYPRGLIWKAGVAGIYKPNSQPLRVVSLDGERIVVDLGHPLAGVPLQIDIDVREVLEERQGDQGGRSNDWVRALTTGPGIEARREGGRADYHRGEGLLPLDPGDDALFYETDRMTSHIDRVAQAELAGLYARKLADGMALLDLMSSLQSHLPAALRPASVTGLGMNARELAANPRLTERLVHDLNRDPRLPLASESLDAALCALSIEYLTRPLAVVDEIARVLKPGAPFIVSWSQRWFPSKAIRLWMDLHPFERVGYVLDLLERSGRFEALESFSVQGRARPDDDPHIGQDVMSDPIFAVWGHRR